MMITRTCLIATSIVVAMITPGHANSPHAATMDLTQATDATPTYRTLAVENTDDLLPGVTRPRRFVKLGSSVDARLMSILVEEGDRVQAGDPVAILDDRVARAALALAESEAAQTGRIARAEAEVERDRRTYERVMDAFDRNAANMSEVDDARAALDVSNAELDRAREERDAARCRADQARARLEEHTVRATFDGVIIRQSVDVGAIVTAGDVIAEVADIDHMIVELYLPAPIATTVQRGSFYALDFGAPVDVARWGRVRYVEPRIDPTSNSMRIVFDIAPSIDGLTVPEGVLVTPTHEAPPRLTSTQIDMMRGRLDRSNHSEMSSAAADSAMDTMTMR